MVNYFLLISSYLFKTGGGAGGRFPLFSLLFLTSSKRLKSGVEEKLVIYCFSLL